MLSSLSQAFAGEKWTKTRKIPVQAQLNLIDTYHAQLLASYYGQDALSLRNQAFDDMLWVVLAYLEALRFVHAHEQQYSERNTGCDRDIDGPDTDKQADHEKDPTSKDYDTNHEPWNLDLGEVYKDHHQAVLAGRTTTKSFPQAQSHSREIVQSNERFNERSNVPTPRRQSMPSLTEALQRQPWYGHAWTKSFAHRARTFWDLAETGWGEAECGGGMNWNPREAVYKNAITNQLWIAASIQMYLDFPGDARRVGRGDPLTKRNRSRTSSTRREERNSSRTEERNSSRTRQQVAPSTHPEATRDPAFLAAAVEGYRWLVQVNMTNAEGLFVDGYHVSGRNGSRACDVRTETVYTYNQGVLLTGQRGLWEATGAVAYLTDGHRLIQSVIRATGWSLARQRPVDDNELQGLLPNRLPPWHGLGRAGVLEEQCDVRATCSQDSQTFKGLFFHHLEYFCRPLRHPRAVHGPRDPEDTRGEPGRVHVDRKAWEATTEAHGRACASYAAWVRHNALAALNTRNADGLFGAWWAAEFADSGASDEELARMPPPLEVNADPWADPNTTDADMTRPEDTPDRARDRPRDMDQDTGPTLDPVDRPRRDWNDRGRGRTVETQLGVLAVVRAWWSLEQLATAEASCPNISRA